MDQETSRIKRHIDTEREELGRNLHEIEDRVKNVTDLKGHFDRNTGWILGAAVAGGFLLSLAFGKSSTARSSDTKESDSSNANIPALTAKYSAPTRLRRVSNTMENIVDGLVGVFSHRLHSFVADVVPGFGEQYDAVEQRRRSSVH